MKRKVKTLIVSCIIAISALAATPVSAATLFPFSGFTDWMNIFSRYNIAREIQESEPQEKITVELTQNHGDMRSRKIVVEWNDIPCDHYEIEYSIYSSFYNSTVKTTGGTSFMYYTTSPSFFNSSATATYYFRVRAVNEDSFGQWSNVVVAESTEDTLSQIGKWASENWEG